MYGGIITTIGLARLTSAQMSGDPLVFTHVAVGDGGGFPITPSVGMTALVNERARVSVNAVDLYAATANTLLVQGLLPANTGGFTIREIGLFSSAGELIVIASAPPMDKPVLADGITVPFYIGSLITYSPASAISLSVDTSIVMATRDYVDNATAGGLKLWENFT